MDVAKAGELVGKVAGGNTGILARYGIQIDKGATATEALARPAGEVRRPGRGVRQDDRRRDGPRGGRLGEPQEVVGKRLAPVLARVANKLADLTAWAEENPGKVKTAAIVIGGLVTAIGGLMIASKVVTGVKALSAAWKLLNLTMKFSTFGLIVTGLVALGVGLVAAYKHSATFRRIVDGAFKAVKTVAIGALKLIVGGLDRLLGVWSTMLGALGHVPGFGWAKDAAAAIDKARKATREWVKSLDDTAKDRTFTMTVRQRTVAATNSAEDRGAFTQSPARRLRRAGGGPIPGSGRGDTVPMLGEPGEFVIQRSIVEKFGPTFFAKLNAGMEPQRFTSGGIVARANALDRQGRPYKWGGGHGDGGKNGWDCSGAISYAVGVPPRVSGQFMSFGLPGPGKPMDTKIYANPTHVFGVFNGRGWGTSNENPGGGPGWLSYNHRAGFTIRHLNDTGGSSSTAGDEQETVESGKATLRERQERAGSRVVNKLASTYLPAIRRATRRATALGTAVDAGDAKYSQSERFFGQVVGGQVGKFGDEDLGTAGGRAARTDELKHLKMLKRKTLGRLKQRKAELERAIGLYEKLLKDAARARKKAKGAKRAKIGERMRSYEERLDELKAEVLALGGAVADTELDIGDLDRDLQEVASTPDTAVETPEAPERVAPTDALSGALGDVDLRERAGDLTPEQAKDARVALLRRALGGEFGNLNEREDLQVRGDLREVTQAQTQATSELAAEMKALRDEVAQSNALARTELAVGLREARRALADIITGDLGARVAPRRALPGNGELSRLV